MDNKYQPMLPRLQQWKSSGLFANSLGHNIFFRDSQSGRENLVLIHGFPTSSFDWIEIWETLASEYRIFSSDLLGFGFSEKPNPYEYTIFEQADIIVDLLQQRGIHEFSILSHDYGTIVAQELLARCNSVGDGASFNVKSATFLNGALFPEMHRPRFTQKLLLSPFGAVVAKFFNEKKFSQSFSEVFGANTQPSQSNIEEFWSLICYNNGQKIIHLLMNYFRERKVFRDRWVHAIQNTSIPISIINGLDDPVSGRHLVERARTELPRARIFELDKVGHYPQVEAPKAVLEAFIDFLNSLIFVRK